MLAHTYTHVLQVHQMVQLAVFVCVGRRVCYVFSYGGHHEPLSGLCFCFGCGGVVVGGGRNSVSACCGRG